MSALHLDPDRALPFPAEQRGVAREIYGETKDLPLICMHGHVEPEVFADDVPFADPAQLLIVPDHYVFRMLASQGIEPARLGVPRTDGGPVETDSRQIWRTFCENWKLFRGTPSRYWLEHELVEVFGVDLVPSRRDRRRDLRPDRRPGRRGRLPAARPAGPVPDRGDLDDRPGDLGPAGARRAGRRRIRRADPADLPARRRGHLDRPSWRADVAELAELSGADTSSYDGFLEALRSRRAAFVAAGARATDHGHLLADTAPMETDSARSLYTRVLGGADPECSGGRRLRGQHALPDGRDVLRGRAGDADPSRRAPRSPLGDPGQTYGQDKGYDIPVRTEFTRALRPMLDSFGNDPRFRVILFTVDETTYSRELAPIAGTYPSVRLGAPWWFLDSPEGMRRFRETAVETAGFYNTSGFVDDTRAFASIPARHDLSRRVDAGYLGPVGAGAPAGPLRGRGDSRRPGLQPAQGVLPTLAVARARGRVPAGGASAAPLDPDRFGTQRAYGAKGSRCFTKCSSMTRYRSSSCSSQTW